MYSAEGPLERLFGSEQSAFLHESGHAIFGLADEYDDTRPVGSQTYYWEPSPYPNIWKSKADGRSAAAKYGWKPDDIWKFTKNQGGWWKLGKTDYTMAGSSHTKAGWGRPGAKRIEWVLSKYVGTPRYSPRGAEEARSHKAIVLDLQIEAGYFSLVGDSFVTDPPPNYLPGGYDFSAVVYSVTDDLLGRYGVMDPRKILAESSTGTSTGQAVAALRLTLPYFYSGGSVDLVDNQTGSVLVSIDISHYSRPFSDGTAPSVDSIATLPRRPRALAGVALTAHITDESGVVGAEYSLDGGASWAPMTYAGAGGIYEATFGCPSTDFAAMVRATDAASPANVSDPVSAWFSVLPARSRLAMLKPVSGKRGATVTIKGQGFGASRGSSSVAFGGKKCTKYLSWSDTRIKCRVPAKAEYGTVKVRVRTAGGTSNTRTFKVKR